MFNVGGDDDDDDVSPPPEYEPDFGDDNELIAEELLLTAFATLDKPVGQENLRFEEIIIVGSIHNKI